MENFRLKYKSITPFKPLFLSVFVPSCLCTFLPSCPHVPKQPSSSNQKTLSISMKEPPY